MEQIADARDSRRIQYRLKSLLWEGVLLFTFRLGARRQLRHRLLTEIAESNLQAILGLEGIAHGDTLDYAFSKLSEEALSQLAALPQQMIQRLIRNRVLEGGRLLGRLYLVVFDGCGVATFSQPHCSGCVQRGSGSGHRYWEHAVLEAKLITPQGLVFSLGTEFIENQPGASKQDCELKAFHRLAERIKKQFPQLSICAVLDGLFPGEPVFERCQDYDWHYVMTLKEGVLPSVDEEFQALQPLQPENKLDLTVEGGRVKQQFRWVTEIDYRDYRVNVLQCREIDLGTGEAKTFAWITDLKVKAGNVREIAQGGRLRWKIENEGFNTQKNGGYGLEHLYSHDPQAMKVFYLLLQVAHIIFQLLEKGSLIRPWIKEIGSSKNLADWLLNQLRFFRIDWQEVNAFLQKKIQIRFDTS